VIHHALVAQSSGPPGRDESRPYENDPFNS
jgi:hypothetical protein